MATLMQFIILFLFAVVFITWKNEGFGRTTSALNTNKVFDLKTINPHVTLEPSQKEGFNFFARDADVVLRGRFVDVTKMTPNRENQSELAMKSEANRLALS